MAKVIDNPFRAYPFPPARLPFELAFHVFSQPVRRAAALSLETGESNLIVEKRFIRDAISVDVELFFLRLKAKSNFSSFRANVSSLRSLRCARSFLSLLMLKNDLI
jgi:hypothetical protein